MTPTNPPTAQEELRAILGNYLNAVINVIKGDDSPFVTTTAIDAILAWHTKRQQAAVEAFAKRIGSIQPGDSDYTLYERHKKEFDQALAEMRERE